MDEFGRPLPLGDLRQALVALSRSSKLWGDLFRYRFPSAPNEIVGGHSLGNLILHAFVDQNEGDLLGALEDAEEMLNAAGHVMPVTLEKATLCAELSGGSIVRGEAEINCPAGRPILPISRVFLEPAVAVLPCAAKALTRADKVLIGAGDLYTSIVPCLLVDGVAEAIRSCEGEVVYICNVMTKRGETDGYTAAEFVRTVHHYLGRRVDTVVLNTTEPQPPLAMRYAREGAFPVVPSVEAVRSMVPHVIAGDFMMTEPLVRHDAERVVLGFWPHLATGR